MSESAAAPDMIRKHVKLAGSIDVCFSASRHKSELLAKAIIAAQLRRKTRSTVNLLHVARTTTLRGSCYSSVAKSSACAFVGAAKLRLSQCMGSER